MHLVIENKKALFSYDLIKKYTAGIKLKGEEVKALRYQGGNLTGTYIKDIGNELFLINFNIPRYKKSASLNYSPKRIRKLLLNKSEISNIKLGLHDKGRTVVPLKVYLVQNRYKVDIALVKAKGKVGQKRTEKEKQQQRDMQRALKEVGI